MVRMRALGRGGGGHGGGGGGHHGGGGGHHGGGFRGGRGIFTGGAYFAPGYAYPYLYADTYPLQVVVPDSCEESVRAGCAQRWSQNPARMAQCVTDGYRGCGIKGLGGLGDAADLVVAGCQSDVRKAYVIGALVGVAVSAVASRFLR